MNIKYLIGTVLETLVKVVILAAVIIFAFRSATQAYEFGYKVFADEPVSVSGGRTITVGIAEGASVKDIALMLEEKGLIEDSQLFVVQELLSAYHDKIIPGIYDLSTSMTAEQMLEIMSTTEEPSADEDASQGSMPSAADEGAEDSSSEMGEDAVPVETLEEPVSEGDGAE